ncbi:response regulator transcription factor [Shewanella canadensis]|uniref:Response regulator transcription factor n=1 Tax=Shewanella canadensis TaxID=271096 RepID=A0A431WVT8_9GAMM|nr:response regulator transcription factor [Shewanella canadensis]RTR39552.1 response regulator transcription factor [Shewanella canadensis]
MKVLVIEDEPQINEQICQSVDESGWVSESSCDGIDALYRATSEEWDMIVLDLGLPKIDGLTVLKGIRDEGISTPVIILSARNSLSQRLDGLNAGADDYLTKPFEMAELITRIRVLIRRSSGSASNTIKAGKLMLDARSSQIEWNGSVLNLTALEFKVLAYFIHNQGKVIPRLELIEHIYKQDFDRDSNTIDVIIGRLRKKTSSSVIKTIRGLGYKLYAE